MFNIGRGQLGEVLAIRLHPGADLYKSLVDIATKYGIADAVILSGAASLRRAVLRNLRHIPAEFPITDEDRVFTTYDNEEPIELLSLSGNISQYDGKPWVHAHITISTGREEGRALGGHLVEGNIIFSTGELVIARIEGLDLVREKDPLTKALELAFKEPKRGSADS